VILTQRQENIIGIGHIKPVNVKNPDHTIAPIKDTSGVKYRNLLKSRWWVLIDINGS
jgi:hypothetical protein